MQVGGRRVAVNAVILTFGVVLASLGSFVFQALIARTYGPDGFGLFSLAVLTVTVVAGIAELGLKDGVVAFIGRFKARDDAERIAGVIVTSLVATASVGVVLAVVVAVVAPQIAVHVFGESRLVPILGWFVWVIPAQAMVGVMAAVCLGFERGVGRVLIADVVPKLLLLALTAAVIWYGYSISAVAGAYVVAFWLTVPLGLVVIARLVREIDPDGLDIDPMPLFRYSVPLLLAGFVGTVLNWTDTLLVGYFLDASAVGIYQTAFLLGVSVSLFANSISGSLFPHFSGLVEREEDGEIQSRFEWGTAWAVRITIPPVVYLAAFPGTALSVLFGPEYARGALALAVIVAGQGIGTAIGPTSDLLKAYERSRVVLWTNAFAVLVNGLVGAGLIPLVGIVGAAIGTAGATVGNKLLQLYLVKSHVALVPPVGEVVRATFATVVVAVGFLQFSVPADPLRFVAHIIAFSASTFIVYLLGGVMSLSELKEVLTQIRTSG